MATGLDQQDAWMEDEQEREDMAMTSHASQILSTPINTEERLVTQQQKQKLNQKQEVGFKKGKDTQQKKKRQMPKTKSNFTRQKGKAKSKK